MLPQRASSIAPITSGSPAQGAAVRRRQRRRAADGGSSRSCPHCGRTFKRTEHLERHPFICICGAAFTRRDLLTRHQRITLHEGEAAGNDGDDQAEATSSPDGSGTKGSRDVGPVSDLGPDMDPAHADLAAAISLSGLSVEGWPQPMQVQVQPQQAPLYTLPGQHPQPPANGFVTSGPGFAQNGFLPSHYMAADGGGLGVDVQFRDFAHFLDGMGLRAEWSPYLHTGGSGADGDGEHVDDDMDAESCQSPDDGHATVMTGQVPARPDPRAGARTPFATWLPSAPTASRMTATLQELAPRPLNADAHPLRVTEEQRTHLLTSLEDLRSVLPDTSFRIPSRHALTRYVTSFFEGFHSHMPFIHLPTWRILDHPLELILSITAVGAQYCFEHRVAERLFFAGKAIALHRLQLRRGSGSHWTSGGKEGKDDEDDRTEMVRALVTLMGFATWEPKVSLVREAFALQTVLAQLLRESGISHDPVQDVSNTTATNSPDGVDDGEDEDKAWREWVRQESARRSKLISFSFLHTHSIAYDVYPVLRSNEVGLRLPCSTPEWKAPTAAAWCRARAEVVKEQLFFQEALGQLLRHSSTNTNSSNGGSSSGASTPPQPLDPIPTPLGNYLLLHGLLQRIHILRDLSLPTLSSSPSSPLPPDEVDKLERALRAWTSGWQQAPESSLDPNNDNGPIPFTSSALVGLAYARLHCHLGPHRRLDSRDPAVVAGALMRSPGVGRGDGGVISALLYAAHMLGIPVRLGVDRVARSQAFFWSVRHSLAGLECAVLLSKWLRSVGEDLKGGGGGAVLTDSEERIVRWVGTIVEEAYAVVDFDDGGGGGGIDHDGVRVGAALKDPAQLGLDVLRIWAHLFRKNAQWKFINFIGQSLEKYRELLTRSGDPAGLSLPT
ncbi:hypothetical protein PpBr36_04893 [Pyricularia pennisetigena]|uniref:hypothetical protein n=1 Tax=Pyricularia pennisetigena TaxID=1578925 RepID=UPI00114DE6BF|nr:hypothetical protein PpBr36_04893 [Pyricularia pennisetigena]TLS26275.1 hypothetical protein PpBr36_04893 [Pyricularia pennisetigena]